MFPFTPDTNVLDMRQVGASMLRSWLRLSSSIMRDPDRAPEARIEHANQVLRLHFALGLDGWGLQDLQDGDFAERILYDMGGGFPTSPTASRQVRELWRQRGSGLAAQGQHYMGPPAILPVYLNAGATHHNPHYQPAQPGSIQPRPQAESWRTTAIPSSQPRVTRQPQAGPGVRDSYPFDVTQQRAAHSGQPRSYGVGPDNAFGVASSQPLQQPSPRDRRSRSPQRASHDHTYRSTRDQQSLTGSAPAQPAATVPRVPSSTAALSWISLGHKRWCERCRSNTLVKTIQPRSQSRQAEFCGDCGFVYPHNACDRAPAQDAGSQAQVQQSPAGGANESRPGTGWQVSGKAPGGEVAGLSSEGGGQVESAAKALGKQPVREEDRALLLGLARAGSTSASHVPLPALNVQHEYGADSTSAPNVPSPAPNVQLESGEGMAQVARGTALSNPQHGQDGSPEDGADDAGEDRDEPDVGNARSQAAAPTGDGEGYAVVDQHVDGEVTTGAEMSDQEDQQAERSPGDNCIVLSG